MAQLKRDVQALRGRLEQAGEADALKIHVDEGQVQVLLQVGSCTKECIVLYLSADDYPNSQMMGMCNNDDELNSKLEGLSEQFEYGASIREVLQQVVGLAGVEFQAIQAAEDAGASEDEAMDQGGESDGDDSGDGSDGPNLYEEGNDERTKEVLQKTSRWDIVEQGKQQADDMAAEAAARMAGQSLSALSMQEQLAKQRQLFSPQEAYNMLAKELKEMMLHPCGGVAVDAVDYNAWQWVMWLEDFEEGSELEKELEQLRKQQGLGSVQLRLTFKRGLHPFYPPLVELLKPRFIGPIPGALSSHPVAQLGMWDPWRTMRALAAQVKMFLQLASRVDAESPMNDPTRHPASAYLPVEQQLARLEALSGAVPLCLPVNRDLYSARDAGVDAQRLEAMAPDAKRSKTGTEDMGGKKKTVWASGVGYGHDHGGGADDIWNASAAEAAQAAHDAELQKLLDELTAGLRQQLERSTGPALAHDGSMETDELDQAELQLCMEALESSCLLPFLDQQLSQASFSDMASRAGYYTSLLSVARCLCCPPLAYLLIAPMRLASEQGASSSSANNLHSILLGLAGQARQFSRVVQHEECPEKQPAAAAEALGPSTTMSAAVASAAAAKEAEEERGMLDLAQLIQSTADASAAVVAGQGLAGTQSGDPSRLRDPEEVYKATLQPLQFDTVSAYTKGTHIFFDKLAKEGSRSRPRMVRIGKEMAGIGSSLPLARGASIFVRVDEQNVQLWKALITGPTDTPYGYGCFEFDMYFPIGYPNSPPSVQIRTTGGGSVRFNPNLYNGGKVCLSLLGTWSGARGESWDPVASSMLQVLISISSLILVEHPYYNEPGYESSFNTPSGQAESKKYTANIREQTLHWAIFQQLKSPSPGFEEVIKAHFRLQKDAIEQQCDTWIREADGAAAKRMRGHLHSWLALLSKL